MAVHRIERVTKLDAARRQLRTAIRMFFEGRDTVSIRTLAAAVEGLLAGLLKQRGELHPFRDSDIIRPERKAEFLQILNHDRNFLKHADKDPDEVLEFRPETVEHFLLECTVLYEKCTGRVLREGWVFFIWFGLHKPGIVKEGPLKAAIESVKQKAPNVDMEKGNFLELLNRVDLWPNTD
jgi:hypothetical protein